MGRERMLAQALYSLLMQDYDDLELVIKDGDPDNPVRDIIALRCFKDEQVNYKVGKDGGIFAAVNDCLKRATGDILHFMCSDDLMCPGTLKSVNEIFERERFGGAYWLYGKTISADSECRTQGIDGEPTTLDALLEKNRIGQPAVFWNRAMMNLAGNFCTRYQYAADYDLWIRFWKRREPWFLDQTLGIFRHHEGSDTQIHQQETAAMAKRVSLRHQWWGGLIERAQNAFNERHAFDDGYIAAHDDM